MVFTNAESAFQWRFTKYCTFAVVERRFSQLLRLICLISGPLRLPNLARQGHRIGFQTLHLIATVIDAWERPPDRGPGHPPTETIRVVATLRRFLREGTPWRSLIATEAGQRLDAAPLPGALDRDGPAGKGARPAGRHAARPSRPDPRHLFGAGQARRRSHRPNPTDRGKRGTKYHIATRRGRRAGRLPPTAANVNDTLVFERLFLAAFAVMARIRTVFADKGYDAEHHRDSAARSAPSPTSTNVVSRAVGLGKRRWPVERSNAWVLENRRLALRYDRLGFSSSRCFRPLAYSWLQPARPAILKTASK